MFWDKFTDKYDDIIDMPHHVSKMRPHMPIEDRAAQFSPFAAMVGHDDAIEETARLTDARIELDEDRKARINEKLLLIAENLGADKEVTITYFVPDEMKAGGEYVTKVGMVKKIDVDARVLVMVDDEKIEIEEIVEIGM